MRADTRTSFALLRVSHSNGFDFGKVEELAGSPDIPSTNGSDSDIECLEQKGVEFAISGVTALEEEEWIDAEWEVDTDPRYDEIDLILGDVRQ